jgi:glucokinase
MYKVQAYNERKDWTYNAVRSGEYASLEEAATGYVTQRADRIIEAGMAVANGVDMDVSSIETRLRALQADYNNGVFNETDTKKVQEIQNLQAMLTNAQTAQQYTNLVKNAQKNMHNQTNMNAIGALLDDSPPAAQNFLSSFCRVLIH